MSSNVASGGSPPTSLSDVQLVGRINAGDDGLLSELYNRYAAKIYYKCLSLVKNSDRAQDMAHDVFIKVSINLNRYKGTADVSFWIYAITYNHCIAQLKKEKRLRFDPLDERLEVEDASEHDLLAKVVSDLRLTQLKQLIARLKKEEELLLLMRYQDGMSIKQISAILKIGESAVKMRLNRVRKHLASILKNSDYEG